MKYSEVRRYFWNARFCSGAIRRLANAALPAMVQGKVNPENSGLFEAAETQRENLSHLRHHHRRSDRKAWYCPGFARPRAKKRCAE
jgi:hypothetical protein